MALEQFVVCQIGQSGNQIGYEFFSQVAREGARLAGFSSEDSGFAARAYSGCPPETRNRAARTLVDTFFRQTRRSRTTPSSATASESVGGGAWIARAVMFDMEPKVVQSCTELASASGTWRYDDACAFTQQSGSGNNWAHGFHSHGPKHREALLRCITREVEQCDTLGGFLVLLSLAGGTGSGLGTYVCEMLREEFPTATVIVQPVWPFRSGEVAVQSYNTVLSLARLQQEVDSMLLVENDVINRVCERMHGVKTVSFDRMNTVIADTLASALMPIGHSQTFSADILPHLCGHQDFKMVCTRSVPQNPESTADFATDTWRGMLKRLYQMTITGAASDVLLDWNISAEAQQARAEETVCRSVANTVICRGVDEHDEQEAALSRFHDRRLYSKLRQGTGFQSLNTSIPCGAKPRSATLITNSQACLLPLEDTLQRASMLFGSKAYLHQYEAHGLSTDDLVESFATTEHVVQQYRSLN
jgi:tubulin delta